MEQRPLLGPAFGAPTGQQVDLQQADRIDVGITQADRLAQAEVAVEQARAVLDGQDDVAGAREFVGDAGVEARMRVAGQQRIALEDGQVGLGQHHFDVVHERGEEGPVAGHLGHGVLAVTGDGFGQAGAHAQPGREAAAVL